MFIRIVHGLGTLIVYESATLSHDGWENAPKNAVRPELKQISVRVWCVQRAFKRDGELKMSASLRPSRQLEILRSHFAIVHERPFVRALRSTISICSSSPRREPVQRPSY